MNWREYVLVFLVLIIVTSGIVYSKIVGSGTAVPVSAGGGGTGNGTVKEITIYEGLGSNETPIISNATLFLRNATTITIGGVHVNNCTGNGHISGYDNNLNPFCSANNGNGTVTSITAGTGLSGGTITSSGTISLNDAQPKQPYFGFSDQVFAWLKPNGTTATVFGGQGWTNFVANGTPNAHGLNQGYYIRYASAASINGSAGLTQTAIQTQPRYLNIIRTSIMTNSTNSNIREYFGLSDSILAVYFSRRGGVNEIAISYDTNASNTAWQCCTNDATALGKSCSAISIDHTTNSPYNLTINMTNYPTNIICTVQNNTAISSVTKATNLPTNTAVNMGVQNVAMAQTASAVNYAIRYVYLESK